MSNSVHLGLSQKLAQSLKMTPECSWLSRFCMNSIELKNQITEILETNPLIELDETKASSEDMSIDKLTEGEKSPSQTSIQDSGEKGREDFEVDWQKYIEDSESSDFKVGSGVSGADEETSYENYVSKKDNLREHLLKQLPELNLNTTEQKVGEYLIGLVDRNGYIRCTVAPIADHLRLTVNLSEKCATLQELEPVGLQHDLRECLLIQVLADCYSNDAVTG